MKRRLPVLVLAALSLLPVPAKASDAGCTSALPVVDPNAANYSCPGVRPGMLLRIPSKKWGEMTCGASFAFTDQFGQRYLTFPGSCHLDFDCLEDLIVEELPPPLPQLLDQLVPICLLPTDSELEPVYKRNGPVVHDLAGDRIGTIAYAVNKDGVNFGLAKLDSTVKLDPSIPLYGGPTRLGQAIGTGVEEVWAYSPYTSLYNVNARTGLLHGSPTNPYVITEGFTSTSWGSSVMKKNGEAVGFFVGMYTVGMGYNTPPLGRGLVRAMGRSGLKLN